MNFEKDEVFGPKTPGPIAVAQQFVRISDFSDVSNGSDWSADILVLNEGEEKTQRAKGAGAQRIQTTSSPLRLCAFCGWKIVIRR